MSDIETIKLPTSDGIELRLLHDKDASGIPVLLLHGASACHETFRVVPEAEADALDQISPLSLMDWLQKQGYHPWLLDWRGSGLVVDAVKDEKLLRERFDFDRAAELDVPAALGLIANRTDAKKIAAVGHCMGAATLAQSIAAGHVRKDLPLTHAVLLTLGLFYEPAWDSRVKSGDYVLERLWSAEVAKVDPRPDTEWPSELADIYNNWPSALQPHPAPADDTMLFMCNRLSFMYGPPYLELNVGDMVHAGGFLSKQFGAIPLRMYLHAAQNVRRGWAAPYGVLSDTSLIGPEARRRFDELESITLITGARNQLWHRDSIDRMYEWLSRRPRNGRQTTVRKHVLPTYGHQDLLWGRRANEAVFQDIIRGGLP